MPLLIATDTLPPRIVGREITQQGIELTFDEVVAAEPAAAFLIDGQPVAANKLTDRKFRLPIFPKIGRSYVVTVQPGVTDAVGNATSAAQEFTLTAESGAVRAGDLLSSDVLVNPRAGATRPEGTRFELAADRFSPDGDGQADVLEVTYFTDRPGLRGRVSIFDVEGRLVRELPQAELASGRGQLHWDGTTSDGRLADRGAYVLLIEVYDEQGHSERYKLVAVLAA